MENISGMLGGGGGGWVWGMAGGRLGGMDQDHERTCDVPTGVGLIANRGGGM